MTAPILAQTPWVHVEVDEGGDDNTHVRVNLPLSVVQVALEAAPEKILENGQIHLHNMDHDLDIEDIRKIWTELREAGDAEFVSIEGDDETVRVRREGDFIRIDVDERKEGASQQIHIEVPVAVVDALFSGEGESLNLGGALDALSTQRGDIVRVDDGETKVRVWIDERD
jgi:hypothetical protein